MLNIELLNMIAALGGYNIANTTDAQSISNKARAQLRVNAIKAFIVGQFGGHWDRNWREGYLGLSALSTPAGVGVFTNGSRTVSGSSTTWTSDMVGSLVLVGQEYYRVASVASATSFYLTAPYQGTSGSYTFQVWQDRYRVYPDVCVIDDFINYTDPAQMSESWKGNLRNSFPAPTQSQIPRLWSVIGSVPLATTYSTGTISGTINSNVLTGNGTAWLSNLEPGWDITFTVSGTSYTYRIRTVDSDSQVTLYQMLKVAVPAATTYSAVGRNSIQVRFACPSAQQLVCYGYYAKDWPFVNDNDSDWISELYPQVMIFGATWFDYLDKNDTVRSREAHLTFLDAIKDVHVAEHMNYSGVRTIGYNIPAEARDQ